MKARLTEDAKVELLRLWGLSAVRAGEDDEYSSVLKALRQNPSNIAKRHAFFVEGFYCAGITGSMRQKPNSSNVGDCPRIIKAQIANWLPLLPPKAI